MLRIKLNNFRCPLAGHNAFISKLSRVTASEQKDKPTGNRVISNRQEGDQRRCLRNHLDLGHGRRGSLILMYKKWLC